MQRNLKWFVVVLIVSIFSATSIGMVSISEVMAKNDATIATVSGKAGLDWIELYNDGEEDVDVLGWYLSDNPKKAVEKWQKIECGGPVVVPAGGYRIIWADKDFADYAEDEAHVAIGLSVDGECIFLAHHSTEELDEKQIFEFGSQIKDVSYGFNADGVACYFREPTPGVANTTQGFGPPTPTVMLSEVHGFKTSPFVLTMTASDPSAEIYYTTNGVEPSTANSILYTGPFIIEHTTLVRAAVPDANSVLQSTATATYLFVDDVIEQGPNPGGDLPATNKINAQILEFGLNASYVSNHYSEIVVAITNTIPVYSIVGNANDFFGPETGIYVNAEKRGGDWERKVSVELFDPLSREKGFQVDCGVKMRGGTSRGYSPKHSFRLVFRSKYGTGKLKYPLFGDEGAKEFDKIDLRADQNNSWAAAKSWSTTFVHDVFCRDVQRDQGQPYTRSRYCHVFLNGQYWGLYQTQERDDSDYASTYLGGEASDWDFIRTTKIGNGLKTDVVDGTLDALLAFMDLINLGVDDAMYHRMMGQNPDGSDNLDYPVYLNDENLMDFIIGLHYEHDSDSPWSVVNYRPNNMHTLYNRASRQGFVWLRHDAEYALGTYSFYKPASVSCLRWGDFTQCSLYNFNPNGLHCRLADGSPQYRRKFAERLDSQVFQPGGVLSCEKNLDRFTIRMDEVEGAVWAECARWGRNEFGKQAWSDACKRCKSFIKARADQLRKHYINAGWYPATARPIITSPKHEEDMFELPIIMTAEEGKVLCWTDDGSDPAESTTVHSNGLATATYVIGTNSVKLTARAYDPEKDEWSLLAQGSVEVTPFTMADRQRMYLRVQDLNLGTDDPFVTITNFSPRLAIPLEGLALGDFLSTELPGTCPSNGVVRLPLVKKADLSKPVVMALTASDGREIQTLRVSAAWAGFGDTTTGIVYFVPRHFGSALITADDWYPWLGFTDDADVQEKVRDAKDPAITSNIVTIADGVQLIDWASRNGMTFSEVLSNDCAYLSYAFDTSGLIDPGWLPSLRDNDLGYCELTPSASDGFAYSVYLRGLSVGQYAPSEQLSKLFSVLGSPTLLGDFASDNVVLLASPTPNGEGGIRFKIAPASSLSSTRAFFVKTIFLPR